MKKKWGTKKPARGVGIDSRGYVFVRLFSKGKALPKKNFGKATSESLDEAARYVFRTKEALRTGRTSVEDQKQIRWTFGYAWEKYLPHCPKSRLYCGKPLKAFFEKYYFDELWFGIVNGYRPWRKSQGLKDNSINLELAMLSCMYHEFKELKLLNQIPNVKLPVQSPRIGVEWVNEDAFNDDRVITDAEYDLIMKEAPLRVQRRIDAALNTGLRRKDIFALRKESMDTFLKRLKGLSFKVKLPYQSPANQVVAKLFETAEGDVIIDQTNYKRDFDQLRRVCVAKYGMRDFTYKDFRRTAGMHILRDVQGDRGLLLCKAFYNHKRIDTTMKYLGVTFEDLNKAGEILAAKFNYANRTEPQTEPQTEETEVSNYPQMIGVQS